MISCRCPVPPALPRSQMGPGHQRFINSRWASEADAGRSAAFSNLFINETHFRAGVCDSQSSCYNDELANFNKKLHHMKMHAPYQYRFLFQCEDMERRAIEERQDSERRVEVNEHVRFIWRRQCRTNIVLLQSLEMECRKAVLLSWPTEMEKWRLCAEWMRKRLTNSIVEEESQRDLILRGFLTIRQCEELYTEHRQLCFAEATKSVTGSFLATLESIGLRGTRDHDTTIYTATATLSVLRTESHNRTSIFADEQATRSEIGMLKSSPEKRKPCRVEYSFVVSIVQYLKEEANARLCIQACEAGEVVDLFLTFEAFTRGAVSAVEVNSWHDTVECCTTNLTKATSENYVSLRCHEENHLSDAHSVFLHRFGIEIEETSQREELSTTQKSSVFSVAGPSVVQQQFMLFETHRRQLLMELCVEICDALIQLSRRRRAVLLDHVQLTSQERELEYVCALEVNARGKLQVDEICSSGALNEMFRVLHAMYRGCIGVKKEQVTTRDLILSQEEESRTRIDISTAAHHAVDTWRLFWTRGSEDIHILLDLEAMGQPWEEIYAVFLSM